MELDADRACSEISGAGAYLLAQPDCASARYGVVGFCMGGGLAQYVATKDPSVGAGVSFYGGFVKVEYDWKALSSPLLLIYAENDKGVPASQAGPLAKRLQALGKDVETVVYPDADHGFFNDTRPSVYKKDAAEDAWLRTLAFFRDNLVGA